MTTAALRLHCARGASGGITCLQWTEQAGRVLVVREWARGAGN
jgi:hypothetical protein